MNAKRAWSCTTCHLEIRHHPVFHVGLAFCCAGCVAGGPCSCSYDEDPIDESGVSEPGAALADDERSLVGTAG